MNQTRTNDRHPESLSLLTGKAAQSALIQRRRGSCETVRALYYKAYSLLRTLRRHLHLAPEAA